MISGQQEGSVEIKGITGVETMGMKVTGKSFSLLIDKLYTRKEDAVVREIGSNSRDAMVAAGKPNEPFHIHLPNDLSAELIFQDHGTGLSKEDVSKYLGTLFESSKDNENDSIGSYGLGSKSPFCVTDSYTIESTKDGQKHYFSFFRAKGASPQLVWLSSEDTDEGNGISFRIPCPPTRYSTYLSSIRSQMMMFNPRPKVFNLGNEVDVWAGVTSWVNDSGLTIIEDDNFRQKYGSVAACMGGVLYPLNLSSCTADAEVGMELGYTEQQLVEFDGLFIKHKKLSGARSSTMVINFSIGDLEIPPSREAIEYDTRSSINIIKEIDRIHKKITAETMDKVRAVAERCKGLTKPQILEQVSLVLNVAEFKGAIEKRRDSFHTSIYDDVVGNEEKLFKVKEDAFGEVSKPFPYSFNPPTGKVEMYDGYTKQNLQEILSNRLSDCFLPLVKQQATTLKETTAVIFGSKMVDDKPSPEQMEDLMSKARNHLGMDDLKLESLKISTGFINGQYILSGMFSGCYWVAKYRSSDYNIKPHSDRLTAMPQPFGELAHVSQDGLRRCVTRHYLLMDNDTDVYKKATWYMKVQAGKRNGYTQQANAYEINQQKAHNAPGSYFLLKSEDGDFSEFIELLGGHANVNLVRLSEIVVPKVNAGLPQADMIRGLRVWEHPHYSKGLFAQVKPPKEGEILPMGYYVYGDGDSGKSYLDEKLTCPIDLEAFGNFMKQYRAMVNDNRVAKIYRLSPSLAKKKEKFESIGIIEFLGYSNNLQSSSKFKKRLARQYLRYTMTRAFRRDYKQVEICGVKLPSLMKEINISGYRPGMGKAIKEALNGNRNNILEFVSAYKRHYGALTNEEVLTMCIDDSCSKGSIPLVWFPKNDYHKRMVGMRKAVERCYEEYLNKNPIKVLCSDIDRSSKAFDIAIQHAKSLLSKK